MARSCRRNKTKISRSSINKCPGIIASFVDRLIICNAVRIYTRNVDFRCAGDRCWTKHDTAVWTRRTVSVHHCRTSYAGFDGLIRVVSSGRADETRRGRKWTTVIRRGTDGFTRAGRWRNGVFLRPHAQRTPKSAPCPAAGSIKRFCIVTSVRRRIRHHQVT